MKNEPFKKEVIMNLQGDLPKAKITFGNSKIFCKYDTLFGNCLAYEIDSESELPAIRNFIKKLNELFM